MIKRLFLIISLCATSYLPTGAMARLSALKNATVSLLRKPSAKIAAAALPLAGFWWSAPKKKSAKITYTFAGTYDPAREKDFFDNPKYSPEKIIEKTDQFRYHAPAFAKCLKKENDDFMVASSAADYEQRQKNSSLGCSKLPFTRSNAFTQKDTVPVYTPCIHTLATHSDYRHYLAPQLSVIHNATLNIEPQQSNTYNSPSSTGFNGTLSVIQAYDDRTAPINMFNHDFSRCMTMPYEKIISDQRCVDLGAERTRRALGQAVEFETFETNVEISDSAQVSLNGREHTISFN